MLQFSIFIYVDIKERTMESVTSVITILTDFNRISSQQLKTDLEQRLDKITHNLRVRFIFY